MSINTLPIHARTSYIPCSVKRADFNFSRVLNVFLGTARCLLGQSSVQGWWRSRRYWGYASKLRFLNGREEGRNLEIDVNKTCGLCFCTTLLRFLRAETALVSSGRRRQSWPIAPFGIAAAILLGEKARLFLGAFQLLIDGVLLS